ncbi:unnamed protein product [Caenorhabditis nigoni]
MLLAGQDTNLLVPNLAQLQDWMLPQAHREVVEVATQTVSEIENQLQLNNALIPAFPAIQGDNTREGLNLLAPVLPQLMAPVLPQLPAAAEVVDATTQTVSESAEKGIGGFRIDVRGCWMIEKGYLEDELLRANRANVNLVRKLKKAKNSAAKATEYIETLEEHWKSRRRLRQGGRTDTRIPTVHSSRAGSLSADWLIIVCHRYSGRKNSWIPPKSS